jgi:flagellar L-ring protein precursor FlgH
MNKITPVPTLWRTLLSGVSVACLTAALAGCNLATRLSEVGDGPKMSEMTNPTGRPGYRPVSMPMPAPREATRQANSLWRPGARAFFRDQRASDVGDIMTVKLSISDSAKLDNKTTRERDAAEDDSIGALFGLERKVKGLLPGGKDGPDLTASIANAHSTTGDGQIDRKEAISVLVAGVITQLLPNGNMVVFGRQEIKVNGELREVMITGIVRPEDIDYTNTISHEKIAELRVAYGGRGTLSDLQQPRWGTQVIDVIFPF